MNTETLNTLKQVREGINETQKALNDATLTQEEAVLLSAVLLNLYKQEDILINNVLQAMVDKVNAGNEELKQLITDMDCASERLARFGNTIKRISNTLGTLAQITAKAISAGIL